MLKSSRYCMVTTQKDTSDLVASGGQKCTTKDYVTKSIENLLCQKRLCRDK